LEKFKANFAFEYHPSGATQNATRGIKITLENNK